MRARTVGVGAATAIGGVTLGYLGLVSGAVPVDLGIGRRTRPLGPITIRIAAPRETVFEVLAQPYLGRATHAMREKIEVLQRGTDMVLAAHHTPLRGGLVATTVETVRFTRPERVEFYLTRGPVPHVAECFELSSADEHDAITRLTYTGELGTDLWALGARWGNVVARPWERSVAASFAAVRAEAERRVRR